MNVCTQHSQRTKGKNRRDHRERLGSERTEDLKVILNSVLSETCKDSLDTRKLLVGMKENKSDKKKMFLKLKILLLK